MKQLLVLRHGKAEENNPGGDHKRNLAERGRRDAQRIGAEIKKRGLVPDIILSSDAARALQTAELCAEVAGYNQAITTDPQIYDGGVSGVIKALQKLPQEAQSVLLVGHNPTLETLAFDLTDDNTGSVAEVTLPTAGLLYLELDIDSWSGLRRGSARLLWQLAPKELG